MFHKNEMRLMIRTSGTIFYSLLYFNSWRGHCRLKYLSPVISVKMERLPGNSNIGYVPVRGRPECDFSHLGRREEAGERERSKENVKPRENGRCVYVYLFDSCIVLMLHTNVYWCVVLLCNTIHIYISTHIHTQTDT